MVKFKKNNKKAFFLLIIFTFNMLISFMPISFAATASSAQVNEAMAIFGNSPSWEKAGYSYSNVITGFNTEINRISALSGKKAKTEYGKWLNPLVYHEYGLIVYGNPYAAYDGEFLPRGGAPTFRNGVQGQYKYLGYDEQNNLITNDHYFPKTPVGIFTTYEEVTWSDIGGAAGTWNSLKEPQKNHLLNTTFEDDDFKPSGSITSPPLLKTFLTGTSYLTKAYVQNDPGLWRKASIRLEYNPNHWNTITYPEMGCSFTGSIDLTPTTYTIRAGENQIKIKPKMTVNFASTDSLQHIGGDKPISASVKTFVEMVRY